MKHFLALWTLALIGWRGYAQTAVCNQDNNGKVKCRALVSSRELDQNQAIVRGLVPEILEKANRQCTQWQNETANMQIGQMVNVSQVVQPEDLATCIDAQVAAYKQYLLAAGNLEMTLVQTIRVGRYADCHYPEKFEAHLYWQWTVALQHRGDLIDSCAETLPLPAAWAGAFR
jgi:hypothetical protein